MLKRFLAVLLSYLEPVMKRAVKSLVENRPVAFGIATLCLAVAFLLGYESWRRADFYERTVERSLSKRTENTPQSYKALEALILSNAETESDGTEFSFRSIVGEASFSPEFADRITDLHNALVSIDLERTKPRFEISIPDLASLSPTRQQEAIVTEKKDLGFLFLPVRLLRISDNTYGAMMANPGVIADQLGLRSGKKGWDCVPTASPICDDVITTGRALVSMKTSTTVPITKDALHSGIERTPAQVYYITETGLNRIVSKEGNDAAFYRNQFRASTVFPARPYYSGAFKELRSAPVPLLQDGHSKPSGKLQDYFYISEPYLDIGGNGVVVTLARAMKYPGRSEGAICFDLRIAPDHALGKKLTDLLDKLEGGHSKVTCTSTGAGDPSCTADKEMDSDLSRGIKDLEAMLKTARQLGTGSDVIGGFAFVGPKNEDLKSAWAGFLPGPISQILHPSDALHFMVPLEPPKVTDPERQTTQLTFLAVTLDVGHYLQHTATLGYVALLLLGLSITIVVIAWAGDAVRKVELQRQRDFLQEEKQLLHTALDNVSDVMLKSPTPYVRLDAEDHIINGNASLAGFLGFPATLDAVEKKLKGTRFQDWIWGEESKTEYHRVQDSRRNGDPVKPYKLRFRTGNHRDAKAWVVSSIVPASQAKLGSLPETFGILVGSDD
jgi:hypothetical protein